jgi:hypothetical protein
LYRGGIVANYEKHRVEVKNLCFSGKISLTFPL